MATDESSGAPAGGAELQFDKVELAAAGTGRACGRCQRRIDDEYFELGGSVVCRACADELGGAQAGKMAFIRALAYGAGAALLGTIVWYAIIRIFNWELGLIAVAVGLFVGFAVRKGSGGRGGWKYQALAIALTYASVTTSKVPFVIQAAIKQAETAEKETAETSGYRNASEKAWRSSARSDEPQPADVIAGAGLLAFLIIFGTALASPFLMGTDNIMGIIILGIALYEAWKINKRIPLTGPFRMGAGAPVVAQATPPPATS